MKLDEFKFKFNGRNRHQEPWPLATVGIRIDVDEGSGSCPDLDVVVLDLESPDGVMKEAIVGDIEMVDKLIKLLELARAKLQHKRDIRDLTHFEATVRKEIKEY